MPTVIEHELGDEPGERLDLLAVLLAAAAGADLLHDQADDRDDADADA